MIAVLLLIHLGQAASESISCEKIVDNPWFNIGEVRTCEMTAVTMINSEDVVITQSDLSVLGLDLTYNRNISFLPVRVSQTLLDTPVRSVPSKPCPRETSNT